MADHLEIPEVIINKPPSAGLWKDQTDEQEMGLTYQELDEYLESNSGSEVTITRIKEMISRSEHKRSLPIDCENTPVSPAKMTNKIRGLLHCCNLLLDVRIYSKTNVRVVKF